METRLEQQIRAAEKKWLELWVRGPAELEQGRMVPQVGDAAPELVLVDHEGRDRALSSFWNEKPALVLFWRHYGCGCGIDRAARLRDEMNAYRDAGAEVVVVGQGEPERAAAYRDQHGIDCPFLCDTEEAGYRTYGLTEFTVAEVLFDAPEEFWSHSREIGEQFIADRREMGRPAVDNPWRRPGEFVIDTKGVIRLAYRWQYCEDFPDPRVHLTAIKLAHG
ncbi:MAG: redoxin domain-containing protein [Actinomycetota bacterium]